MTDERTYTPGPVPDDFDRTVPTRTERWPKPLHEEVAYIAEDGFLHPHERAVLRRAAALLSGPSGTERERLVDHVAARTRVAKRQGHSYVDLHLAHDEAEALAALLSERTGEREPVDDCGACHRCLEGVESEHMPGFPVTAIRMILCPTCGNKRCPRASDHRLTCTGSNKPGQPGSVYAAPEPEPCSITEYDGAFKCTTHNRTWGAVTDPDEPCEAAEPERGEGALAVVKATSKPQRAAMRPCGATFPDVEDHEGVVCSRCWHPTEVHGATSPEPAEEYQPTKWEDGVGHDLPDYIGALAALARGGRATKRTVDQLEQDALLLYSRIQSSPEPAPATVLSDRDRDHLLELLDEPPEPNAALRAALASEPAEDELLSPDEAQDWFEATIRSDPAKHLRRIAQLYGDRLPHGAVVALGIAADALTSEPVEGREPGCPGCARGDAPVLLDEHGTLTSISGLPGRLGHGVDDYWWYCEDYSPGGAREALRPFAAMAESCEGMPDDFVMSNTRTHPPITVGDFRRAARVLDGAPVPAGESADERRRLTTIAFNRLTSMLAQVYGEEGLPDAPEFVARAHGYATRVAMGITEWVRPEGDGNTPEEAAIVAIGEAGKTDPHLYRCHSCGDIYAKAFEAVDCCGLGTIVVQSNEEQKT